jgi:polar amino acid transport system substrate-binding protein
MRLKFTIGLAAILFQASFASGFADENAQILFSNPLVRDSVALPKLQGLRFATVDGFAPFSAFDANGTLRGVHVDLARAICAELKITTGCTLQPVAFDEIERQLVTGQTDVGLAGLVPTQANRKNLSFSVPYFRYPAKFLAVKDKQLSDGIVVGVIKDSAHQKMAQTLFSTLKLTAFDSVADALVALKAGTISALFADGLQLAMIQNEDRSLICCELQTENYFLPDVRPDSLSAAVANSRGDVLAAVNAALRKMAGDGRLEEIYLRYVPVNPLR